MEIEIPPEKLVINPEWANRSPHGYVFMSNTGVVYCAGFGPLI